jgi:hypothetical protein
VVLASPFFHSIPIAIPCSHSCAIAGTCRVEEIPNATRDSPNSARTGATERLPREEWCDCFALAPRKQAGYNAAKGLGWPGLDIDYTTEAYLCQRVVPHLRNESPPDQSRTRILRTETMTKSLHVIAQHQLLRVRMQVHLLVHPLRHQIAVQVVLGQCQGHDQRHKPLPVVLDEAQEL